MKHVILGGLLALAPVYGFAQDDANYDEIDAALAESIEEGAPDPDTDKDDLPEIGEDQLAVFVLDRGFYLAGDLGAFFTIGSGIKNGPSNLQPFMAVKMGYDFGDWVGAEITFSTSYVSGNPASEADRPGAGGGEIANFSLFNLGAQVVFAVRPTDRFALEPRVGGGISLISPGLTDPANPTPSGEKIGTAPHLAIGLDLKYLTLLTDFSAGLAINAFLMFPPGLDPIIGLGPAVNVRYTF